MNEIIEIDVTDYEVEDDLNFHLRRRVTRRRIENTVKVVVIVGVLVIHYKMTHPKKKDEELEEN